MDTEKISDERKWINYIKEYCYSGDTEIDHSEADNALCMFLRSLGYLTLVEQWEDVDKWYA